MEAFIMWAFLLFSISMVLYMLIRPPYAGWLYVYLLTALLSTYIAATLVELELFKYPERLLPDYFSANLLFDNFFFPVVNVWYVKWTLQGRIHHMIIKSLIVSAGITILEVLLERYTALIHYIHWNGWISLITIALFLLMMRAIYSGLRKLHVFKD